MAIVRHSLTRWWIVFATTVGTMPTTADASACATMDQGRSAVASGITGDCPEARSHEARVPAKSRLGTADRLIAPASETDGPVRKSRSQQAPMAVPDGSGSSAPVDRLWRGSLHRPHRRPHALPKIRHSYDPNDDTASDDPDDDDEPSIFLHDDDSDDGDVLIIAWVEERVPCLIPQMCAPVTWTAPSSCSLPMLQRLRC